MHIHRNEPLALFNTLRLNAKAAAFTAITSAQQLQAAWRWSQEQALPILPLGEGSNIVLAGDVEALMLKMELQGVHLLKSNDHQVELRVQAGENWHAFVDWSLQQGYCGLENLALIPGTVGAAPVQNIGAYGVEIAEYLRRVHVLELHSGVARTLQAHECAFGYRDSIFKAELRDCVVITAIDLVLNRHACPRVEYPALAEYFAGQEPGRIRARDVFDAVVRIRQSKLPDPAVTPNAGSFFKNPVVSPSAADALQQQHPALPVYAQPDGSCKLSAAWMIEFCGWKGRQTDGVAVHKDHALVLVNAGSDSGKALLDLAQAIAADVASQFDIALQIEPRVYGAR